MFDLSWITRLLAILSFLSTFFGWLQANLPASPA